MQMLNSDPPGSAGVAPPGRVKTTRVVASYKIDAGVKQDFARFVKRLNRDREPGEEDEIAWHVERALRQYMAGYPATSAGLETGHE